AIPPARANIHHWMAMRKAKASNQRLINSQAIGVEIRKAKPISIKKFLESNKMIFVIEDPNTLRMPISLILPLIKSRVKANKPKQEMAIATEAPAMTILAIRRSLL